MERVEKQMTSDYVPNHYYDSYGEYKFHKQESELRFLIGSKYMRLLGEFIETMYSGLRFDILIKYRNSNERMAEWYGMTYMELVIFDVISSPVYNPMNFEPSFRTPHYDGYINGESFYDDIESYIPEINKHLLISYRPLIQPHVEIHNMDFNSIPEFECWKEHFRREYMYAAIRSSEEMSFASRRISEFNMF